MMYQIGLILILIVIALVISKKFNGTDTHSDQLIFEDDMDNEELKKLDEEIY